MTPQTKPTISQTVQQHAEEHELYASVRARTKQHQIMWRYVPLQDFMGASNLDWSATFADLDAQHYTKYDRTSAERAFIGSMIKAMECEDA